MGLFEEAGIILKSGEEIVKRAICKGKVPKGAFMGVKMGFLGRGGLKRKVEWEDVKGEIVLTNGRLIIVGKRGRIRKEVVPFLDFDLKNVIAVSTKKPLMGKEKLLVSMNLETGRPEKMELLIIPSEETSEWVSAIRSQLKA